MKLNRVEMKLNRVEMCLPIVESSIDENPVSRALSKGLSHRSAPILFSLDFF